MKDFTPIADHGMIGDLQTAALVTTDGTIDWYCCPRFDAPSIFAALLDRGKGGYFQIAPETRDYVAKQLYYPDSAILITRFMAPSGVGEVADFMPIDHPERVTARHRLVRVIRVVRGEMSFSLDCAPRFDYARQTHTIEMGAQGAAFRSPALTLTLHATMPLKRHEQDVRGSFTLRAGQSAGVVLESAADSSPKAIDPQEIRALADQTARFWRKWLDRSTYTGRWREIVRRSAMTLKMMIYAPTGAPVAAVTTGLPEQIGGERNWDYRYTWIRDASFSVHALLGLGYVEEADAFLNWVSARTNERPDGKQRPLQIMYRVDGSAELHEETLDHLEGYMQSRPVRIGNDAADQVQLDIYGEALDCLFKGDQGGIGIPYQGWMRLSGMMDWLSYHWDEPEEGIWETRGGRQNFTYGRLMSWVAFDRAIRLATAHGLPADLPRLTATRDAIYQQIMEHGWNAKREAFVQHYATDVLDASLLMMPLVGFVTPQDPRWLSTLRAMDAELVSDSLVYRYNPVASPDGLRGVEGTFSIATYWYVDALARSGRLDDARFVFEKMSTYGNHLGLYSEQIALTGEQQGNFPQAFTHLALINAALNLNYQLDHGAGHVELNDFGSKGAPS